jgi:phosphoribosylformylglycinamidine cyclo-ligase
MARIFNCGIGMVAVVDPKSVDRVTAVLEAAGERVHPIDRIVARAGDEPSTHRAHTGEQWPG